MEIAAKLFAIVMIGSWEDYCYNKAYYAQAALLISLIKTLIAFRVVQILQHSI